MSASHRVMLPTALICKIQDARYFTYYSMLIVFYLMHIISTNWNIISELLYDLKFL